MKVDVTIPQSLVDRLQSFVNGSRSPLNVLRVMGAAVKEKTVDYLRDLSGSRHSSANRLGGTPTGFLADRTQAVENAPLTVSGSEASFTINHPGAARAFHDVTITPGNGAHFIPIPLNALAYGHSPREFQKNIFIKKGAGTGGAKKVSKPIDDSIPAWLLVESVMQPQDRTLLPSPEEWGAAAKNAAIELITSA